MYDPEKERLKKEADRAAEEGRYFWSPNHEINSHYETQKAYKEVDDFKKKLF